MEIFRYTQDKSLIEWDALLFVPPFPGELDSRLDSLSSSIHGQHHLETEEFGNKLSESWENIIIKRSGAQGQPRSLFHQGLDQLRMTMTLIDGPLLVRTQSVSANRTTNAPGTWYVASWVGC